MFEYVKPAFSVFLIVVASGVAGGVMAANRGRNVAGWCLLCVLLPPLLLYLYFARPLREVEGKFRKCKNCGELFTWDEPVCPQCRSAQGGMQRDVEREDAPGR